MDTYYALKNKKKYKRCTYIGSDPNLKYQRCFIIGRDNNGFRVKFFNEYLGAFEVHLNKRDILVA